MLRRLLFALFAALLIVAPAAAQDPRQTAAAICEDQCLHPAEAVVYAGYLAPNAAVAGRFAMIVRGVGERRGRWFLNSEEDYRDQNCLTLRVSDQAATALLLRNPGKSMRQIFEGRTVVVSGVARRVQIAFFNDDGQPSGSYYYQTHVIVNDPDQIVFAD